jgi:hypothetical protein
MHNDQSSKTHFPAQWKRLQSISKVAMKKHSLKSMLTNSAGPCTQTYPKSQLLHFIPECLWNPKSNATYAQNVMLSTKTNETNMIHSNKLEGPATKTLIQRRP